MSCYRCDLCEEIKDADWIGCFAHPTNDRLLICECCLENLLEENENE